MTKKSNHRGNPTYFDESSGIWKYESGNLWVEGDPDPPCGVCGRDRTPEEHDACIANLPGVMNACCGHGDEDLAYIQFIDGRRLAGSAVKRCAEMLMENVKCITNINLY